MADELSTADLETAYERLAQAIDDVGPQQEREFLTKLALALANRCGDLQQVTEAIDIAKQDLAEE